MSYTEIEAGKICNVLQANDLLMSLMMISLKFGLFYSYHVVSITRFWRCLMTR